MGAPSAPGGRMADTSRSGGVSCPPERSEPQSRSWPEWQWAVRYWSPPGRAVAWGSNTHGELGNNSRLSTFTVPVAVDTLGVLAGKSITAINASSYAHTCAVAGGLAFCWGENKYGQLGNDSTTDSRDVPPPAVGLSISHRARVRVAGCDGSDGPARQHATGVHCDWRGAGRQERHRDQRRDVSHVCGG